MIYCTGDTHGNWEHRLNMTSFPEQKEMTKDDYVIITGDFGIWDNSKIEKYNLDSLNKRSFTTLFVDGNHSNFDILDKFPVKEWNGGKVHEIRPHVLHLMRGEIFTIEGKKFFAFGGASSHDISAGILEPDDPDFKEKKKQLDKNPFALYRINHQTWWERELPSEEEMKNGIDNLKKYDNKIDYIITHTPPASVIALLGHGAYKQDILTKYLEEIRCNTEYQYWFMGHMHCDRAINDKDILLYEQIIRIV